MFFSLRKRPSTNHDLPSIHHNFTTKTPRKNTHCSEAPSQKTPINPKKHPFPPPTNFSEINRFRMTKWTGRVNG
jgi:hypothetical protein